MKPGASFVRTGVLPSERANSNVRRSVSLVVSGERITSTSFIRGAGLKKCRPTNRPGRRVPAASSVMESDDVLEAKIVSSRQAESSSA
jgi:hypothetical protein